MNDRSTPGQRAALERMAQEFNAIRRRFDEDDWAREMQWASTHAVPVVVTADWEHLFNAVKARLGQVVEDLAGAGTHSGLNGRAAVAQSGLLESVTALDQLHAMLALEFGRRNGLEALDDRLMVARDAPPGARRMATFGEREAAESLLRRADAAMSRAKRQQASYAVFDGRTDA